MTRLSLVSLCLGLAPAAFGYSYYYNETFSSSSLPPTHWTKNGSLTAGSSGLTQSSVSGSLVSNVSVPFTSPATAANYEVETTLSLTASGGTFVSYLEATSDALVGTSGTYYSIEVNPTFSGSTCIATVTVSKRVSGTVTALASTGAYCSATTVVRAVRGLSGLILVYVNNVLEVEMADTSITSGLPGVGVSSTPTGNSMVSASLGSLDIVAPTAIPSTSIGTSSFPDHVDFQWQGTIDNSGGVGIAFYQILRKLSGGSYSFLTNLPANLADTFSDTTVVYGHNYVYLILAYDYHLNGAGTTINVTTPGLGDVDPRRTGVRPTGAYWGASPEQIDLLSGNLNFSLPLLKAQGRGSGIGFSLSYNSQNWRQDHGGVWNLGRDVGYGYGWKLSAGSITPYWTGYYTVDHYTFTDASGAEYRLGVNNGSNVWSSAESIYLSYDATAGVLHFPDGSFWKFDCESGGEEQDAGTLYPTTIEDANGNQILLTYDYGAGATWANSSARPLTIEDVRAVYDSSTTTYWTYKFIYNGDTPVRHLTSITNSIGTGEAYGFTYSGFTLTDPFTSTSFGSSSTLTAVSLSNDTPATYNLWTDSSGGLTKAQLMYGGYIRWEYGSFTYTSSRIQKEIANRYLSKDNLAEAEYTLTHETDDDMHTIHAQTTINDPGLVGQKFWAFSQTGANLGLATTYKGNDLAAGTTKVESDFSWTSDSANNNYISQIDTLADPGQTFAATKRTTQTVDVHGNVTQVNNYDWGSLSTPARTYNYSYLSSGSYPGRYIFNRLTSATVTHGTTTLTLATNTYDDFSLIGSATPREWDSGYSSVTVRGNLTKSYDVSGILTTIQYDRYGNVSTGTGPSGVSGTVSTSSTTNYAAPEQITVGSSLTTSLTYGNAFMGPTNETGPSGTSVSLGYDANARPTSSTSAFGATTVTAYTDGSSNPNVCISVNSRWTQNQLDGLGRTIVTLTGTYASSGQTGCSSTSGAVTLSRAETTYDSCGCSPLGKVKVQTISHSPSVTYPNSAIAYSTFTYDGIGRTLSKATTGAGSTSDTQGTTTYTYQGNQATISDPAGKTKAFTMDAFGNLTQVTEDPITTLNPSGLNYVTNYTYDLLNHLTGVSMSRSTGTQTRSFVYYGNFLQSATNPENGTVSYTYASNSKVATRTDAKGQVVVYSYDSYARLSKVQRYPSGISGGEDTCQQEDYYYDGTTPSSSSTVSSSLGHLSAVQYWGGYNPTVSPCDTTFVETYTYGTAGAPLTKDLAVGRSAQWMSDSSTISTRSLPVDLIASFAYDNEGRMISEQYPSYGNTGGVITGPDLGWGYDKMGRLATMTDLPTSTAIISGTTYGPANELTAITGGTWGSETRGYNSLKQLTSISSANVTYAYPTTANNGKISSQTDTVSGEVVTYTYDSLNRLLKAEDQPTFSGKWGQQFTYDGFGNLTGTSVTQGMAPTLSIVYDANNHAGGEDANGNPSSIPYPITGGSIGAYYDVENRLTGVASVGVTGMSYSYAPGNKRVWRGSWTYSGGTYTRATDEITFWSVSGQKLATYTVTSSQGCCVGTDDYTAPQFYVTQNTANEYFGGRLIVNATGAVLSNRQGSIGKFFPYGVERSATANGTEKYTGYFRDTETGNDYADQRYMSPGYGRFLTPDRASGNLVNSDSWNKYAHTGGDPINRVDPTGNSFECIDQNGDVDCFDNGISGGGGGLGGFGDGGVAYDYCFAHAGQYVGDIGPCFAQVAQCQSGSWDTGDAGLTAICESLGIEPQATQTHAASPNTSGLVNRAYLLSMQKTLDDALSHSDCASVFGSTPLLYQVSGRSAQTVLDNLISGGSYGSIVFGSSPLHPSDIADTSQNGVFFHTYTITINNTIPLLGWFDSSDAATGEETVLHELGHVLTFMGWSGGIKGDIAGGGEQNDAAIWAACGKYLQ